MHSRRWVMDTVKIRDGWTGDGADLMMTSYLYDTGYYDRKEKVFYGFAKVTESHHNTEDNNSIYRKYARYYFNDAYYRKGLNMAEFISNGGDSLYIMTLNKYSTQDLTRDNIKSKYVTLDTTITCFFEGTGHAQIRQIQTFKYDTAYGNLIQKTDSSTTMPQITMNVSYHAFQDLIDRHRVSIPDSIVINGFRTRTTKTDDRGRMTEIRDYTDHNNYLTTQMEYDEYGNVIRIIYPNHSYSYTYDAVVHAYPVTVRDTFGNESHSKDYDFRFGIPRTVVDKSGNKMRYTLDQFGRIKRITSPKDQCVPKSWTDSSGTTWTGFCVDNDYYTIKYAYYSGNLKQGTPFAAFTQHRDTANPGNDIETYTYCDGLGRVIQTKRDAEIACENKTESMIVSGKVYYDAFGRTVKTRYPTVECKTRFVPAAFDFDIPNYISLKDSAILHLFGDTLVPCDTISHFAHVVYNITDNLKISRGEDSIPPSTTAYDILDRPLKQTAPDNTSVTYCYGFGDDGKGHTLFKTNVTDQNKHTSTSLANVNKQQYFVQPAGHLPVHFEYNLVGDLLKVKGADFERSYLYDQLGRKTQYQEDSLKEIYVYAGSNLVEKQIYWNESGQTRNKTIAYHYNHNRLDTVKSSEYDIPIVYIYNSKGKVDTIKDQSGMQVFEYGNMGEVTRQTRIYQLPFMAQSIRLETSFEYDSWGRTLNMTYPDSEKVFYV